MSDSDDDVKSREGSEDEETKQIPIVWKFAQEDKVGPIVKHLKELEEEEFTNAIRELHPSTGQPLMMWATLKQRFVLVEWLVNKAKREAFVFGNDKNKLDIFDKFEEKRQEKKELDAQREEERKEREAQGEQEEEEEEEAEPEPEVWQLVKAEFGEDATDELIQEVGELGIYEGGRDALKNRHGLGKALFPNGDVYIGEYRAGKRHGIGTYVWSKTGHLYIGQWRENRRWGVGRMVYKAGGRYYGAWERDRKHGHGRYTYPNGDTYDGMWLDDRKEGEGTYTFATDSSRYSGVWHNGDFTSGRWLLCSGAVYYGSFKDFRPNGKGVYVFGSKFKQEGEYKNGKWCPQKVDNMAPDVPADLQVRIQRQQITLRFTPEGDAQDGGALASLVGVVNFKPYQDWVAALESQDKPRILVRDVQVRCIDRDNDSKDITGVRLRVDACDGTLPEAKQIQLAQDEVYVQRSEVLVCVILVHNGQSYFVTVRAPNLATNDVVGAVRMPHAVEGTAGDFYGAELAQVRMVTGAAIERSNTIDLTEKCFGSRPPPSLLTSSATSSASFTIYLYKQQLRTDKFEALQQSLQYYSGRGGFLTIGLTPLEEMNQVVKDVPTLTALTMIDLLGSSLPSQTVPMDRPTTPQPPAPEPVPIYTEAEIAMQNAILEAERVSKQKPQDERQDEDEDEEA